MRDFAVAWRSSAAARVRVPIRVSALVLAVAALLTVTLAAAVDAPSPGVVRPGQASSPQTEAAPGPPLAPAVVPGEPSHDLAGPGTWMSMSSNVIDRTTLAAEGVAVLAGANVFAARIVDGGPSPAYVLYEAGGGAFSSEFYPASSIKVLAALGALELAYSSGFTGEATVDGAFTLADFYDGAIRYSSNEDYDTLVRIAGVGWLNGEFLPSRGYRSTRIQQAYAGGEGVAESVPVHLTEQGRELTLPARIGDDDYGCAGSNCSTLLELVDSVRRVVLHDELATEERFEIAPRDVAGLQEALLGADSWIGAGVAEALGPDAIVYSKPGWTTGHDCVDVGLVVDLETSRRYLIGVSAPDDGECAILATMAADVLNVLSRDADGQAVRTDGSTVEVVDGRQRAP